MSHARLRPLVAALVAAACVSPAPAWAATTITPLPSQGTESLLVEPSGATQVLLNDYARRPTLTKVSVPPAGELLTTKLLPSTATTPWAGGALLPDDGAVIAFNTRRPPHPRVRAFIRSKGVDGRAFTISDKAHAARLSQVVASPSGAAAAIFWQHLAGQKRSVMRVALRGVGQPRFNPAVDLPKEEDGFAQVIYNDAGDGVLLLQANGSTDVPAIVVRRIGRDGSIGAPIVVDSTNVDIVTARAAVAPNGDIGVAWNRISDRRRKKDLLWTTLAAGQATPAPAVRLGEGGDSSTEVENLDVAWAGTGWLATDGLSTSRFGPGANLRIFETDSAGAMALARSYASRSGLNGARLIGRADGSTDAVWTSQPPSNPKSGGVTVQLLRAHRAASGSWASGPEVLDTFDGGIAIRELALRPAGGLAIVTERYPEGGFGDGATTQLLRTDD